MGCLLKAWLFLWFGRMTWIFLPTVRGFCAKHPGSRDACLTTTKGGWRYRRLFRRVSPTRLANDDDDNIANNGGNVQVFDNVFSANACDLLHELALDVRRSFVFCRPTAALMSHEQQREQLLTPLETALDSVLTLLGDSNAYVEYWTRQEYINMDLHADLDEEQLLELDGNNLRFPTSAHVLYLHVVDDSSPDGNSRNNNDDNKALRAPTVLWNATKLGTTNDTTTVLTTIPAVAGRLLRFPGHMLHAVPKPPTRWLFSPEQQEQLDAAEEFGCGDDGGDDDDDDDMDWDEDANEYDKVRSVILFNTWSEKGPRGVPRDDTWRDLPEGIALDVNDEMAFVEDQKDHRIQEWNALYGSDMLRLLPNQRNCWKSVMIHKDKIANDFLDNLETQRRDSVFLPLMGNQLRRQVSDRFVRLHASREQLTAAVLHANQPSKVQLLSPKL